MGPINTVAVIGAGPSGRAIAQAAALAGFRTILVDILPASLRRAQSEMRDRVEQAQKAGRLSTAAADAALARLEVGSASASASSLPEAAREADLVIEAVPDEMESKLEMFTLLDKISRPGTILASTTAGLSVSEIASITYRKAKIVGMRFRFPAQGLEPASLHIVRTPETDQETTDSCLEVGRRLGIKVEVMAEVRNNSI